MKNSKGLLAFLLPFLFSSPMLLSGQNVQTISSQAAADAFNLLEGLPLDQGFAQGVGSDINGNVQGFALGVVSDIDGNVQDAVTDVLALVPQETVSELSNDLEDFSTALANLRPTTTSVAASLISSQAVYSGLGEILESVVEARQQVEGEAQRGLDRFITETVKVREGVQSIGTELAGILVNGGGTETVLEQLGDSVSAVSSSLGVMSELKGFTVEGVQTLKNNLKGFNTAAIRGAVTNIGNESGAKVFAVINDLSGELSAQSVLDVVKLRGGFNDTVNLPGDLGQLSLYRQDSGSSGNINLVDKSMSGILDEVLSTNINLKTPAFGNLEETSTKLGVRDTIIGRGEVDREGLEGLLIKGLDTQNAVDLGSLGKGDMGSGISNVVTIDNRVNGNGYIITRESDGLGSHFEGPLGDVRQGGGGVHLGTIFNDRENGKLISQEMDQRYGGLTLSKGGDSLVTGGSGLSIGQSLTDLNNGTTRIDNLARTDSGLQFNKGDDRFNSGLGSLALGNLNIDLKEQTSGMAMRDEANGGISMTRGEDNMAGSGSSSSSIIGDINLKNLTANSAIDRLSGIGGTSNIGGVSTVGGSGQDLKSTSYLNLKEGIAGLDLLNDMGTDGKIKLPGNLGGLVYDIDDLTNISGHIDIKDLSKRSLEILKDTKIVTDIDLPGDELENIRIEINPKIDTSKLGELRVLRSAEQFSEDIKGITDFNMLNEENLVKAVGSGVEFLARLDILDALRNEIGTISALPEVAARVNGVLADMTSILATLRKVKGFPATVRLLGEALQKFEVSDLLVQLTDLEALAAPTRASDLLPIEGALVGDMVAQTHSTIAQQTANVANAIPNAAANLSSFQLAPILDTATIIDNITSSARNIAQFTGFANAQQTLAGGVTNIGKVFTEGGGVNALTSGVAAVAALGQMSQVIQSVSGLDLAQVLSTSVKEGIDLNDLTKIDQIMKLTNLDEALSVPLGNIIRIANLQEIDLGELLYVADLEGKDVNNLLDLSDLFDADLPELNLFSEDLSEELDALLYEPFDGIVTDALGNAVLVGVDIGQLDLKSIINQTLDVGVDINNLDVIEGVLQLVGLEENEEKANDLVQLIKVANWNSVDLAKLPQLFDLVGLNFNSSPDVQNIVGSAEIGRALELVEIEKVASALKGTASIKQVAEILTTMKVTEATEIVIISNKLGVTEKASLQAILDEVQPSGGVDVNEVLKAIEKATEDSVEKVTGISNVSEIGGAIDTAAIAKAASGFMNSDFAKDVASGMNQALQQAVLVGGGR